MLPSINWQVILSFLVAFLSYFSLNWINCFRALSFWFVFCFVFFILFALGVYWTCIYWFKVFTEFGKILVIISSNYFCPFLPLSKNPVTCIFTWSYPTAHSCSVYSFYFFLKIIGLWVFQMALVIKNPPANAGDGKRYRFNPWVEKIP